MDAWYKETRAEILAQATLKADSVYTFNNEEKNFKEDHYYFQGKEFLSKAYYSGILRIETHYTRDRLFSLTKEYCDNGNTRFEGIQYEGAYYGYSSWYHCDGKLNEEGYRFNGQKIGRWREFNAEGSIINEVNHHDAQKLDSLPVIVKLQVPS